MIFLPRDVTPWLLYRNWKIVGTKIISFLSRRFGCNLWTVLQHTVLEGGSFGKLCAVPGIGFVLVLYFLQRGFNEARVYVRLSALQFLVKDRDMLGYEIYIFFFVFDFINLCFVWEHKIIWKISIYETSRDMINLKKALEKARQSEYVTFMTDKLQNCVKVFNIRSNK